MKPPREVWVVVNAYGFSVVLDGERRARATARRLKGAEALRYVPAADLEKAKELLRECVAALKTYEVSIDGEWGSCRDWPSIEASGDHCDELKHAMQFLKDQ